MTLSSSSVARLPCSPGNRTEGLTQTLGKSLLKDYGGLGHLAADLNTEWPMVRLWSPPERGREGAGVA